MSNGPAGQGEIDCTVSPVISYDWDGNVQDATVLLGYRRRYMQQQPRAATLMTALAGARAHLASRFPLGITARLSISLVAVAVLGAAANMLAQESVSIIRIRMSAPPNIPAALSLPATPSGLAPLPPVRPNAPPKKSIDGLTRAVDRFERASQMRAKFDSPAGDGEYLAAAGVLQNSSLDLIDNGFARNARTAAAARLVAEYLDRGRLLVGVADQRRFARIEHSRRLEAIDTRIQHSLGAAWKIFGRVLARQSLLQLRAHFDAIRQHSQAVVSGDAVSTADLDLLAADENAFAASLEAHRKNLEKTDGVNWVAGMREDFDSLVALRTSLYALNVQYDDEVQRFSQAHLLLATAIAAASERSEPPASARAAPLTVPRSLAVPAPAAQPAPAIQSAPAAQLAAAQPVITPAPAGDVPDETPPKESDRSNRNLMASVTIIVILFITAISFLTVRSVLTPVRRILRATAQLANGNMRVRVARGGIRELDNLANAFNEMAARLAAAHAESRTQHETLEATVLERTHKLQQLAQQDPLTSLPNRRHLSALLDAAIESANRDGRYVGVCVLDIDNFKYFNDSLGHVFGDRVLVSVAKRLEEVADGLGFVARLGGDEFTFVYRAATSAAEIEAAGWNLVRAFHKMVSVDDRDFSISVSIGASIYPDHGRDAEVLLRAADSALFRAKELGRSQLAVFTPELTETAATRFTIEQGLRRAIRGAEFELVYQPEINLAGARIGLVEALLRWRMPDGRLARPGEFLGVAEQSGLITEINAWVLRSAAEAASRWFHGGWPEVRVAINISPRQLLDQRFVLQILSLLDEFRLPAKCLELELTEMVLQTGSATIAALRVLQSHGFGIALDDFGTGYSSLSSMEQLPLSRIKLDRSLIAGIDTSARSAAIARAIIDLCGALGLQVTAEGIERPQQFAWLLGYRDMLLQGYLLSDSVPFAEVLGVKASLANKINDLMLSLPARPRPHVVRPNDVKIIANS
jgi:diguanylate cyclase (GGDEF)-like protein